jgi:hypothetical protein
VIYRRFGQTRSFASQHQNDILKYTIFILRSSFFDENIFVLDYPKFAHFLRQLMSYKDVWVDLRHLSQFLIDSAGLTQFYWRLFGSCFSAVNLA